MSANNETILNSPFRREVSLRSNVRERLHSRLSNRERGRPRQHCHQLGKYTTFVVLDLVAVVNTQKNTGQTARQAVGTKRTNRVQDFVSEVLLT